MTWGCLQNALPSLAFGLFVHFQGGNIEDGGPVKYLALK